jgi:DNA modification methylase
MSAALAQDSILPEYKNGNLNKLSSGDHSSHNWYRFVLSYPPHLVQHYLEKFQITANQTVLDPFCGTGTTLVECKKQGIPSIGCEMNYMAWFASATKVNWSLHPTKIRECADRIAEAVEHRLDADGLTDHGLFANAKMPRKLRKLLPEADKLLLKNSISPLPLHKLLLVREVIDEIAEPELKSHLQLALAKTAVEYASNLHFGPEVGIGEIRQDAPVVEPWRNEVHCIANDLVLLNKRKGIASTVHNVDSRNLKDVITDRSIDAIITSPPYPNEKDYTRTTRLESVLLGFISNKEELRFFKKGLIRSNTRGVYKEDVDDHFVTQFPKIQAISEEIERRRIEMGKTSGFERLYARVTRLYFGGMARHFSELRSVLKPGARLAYVVGDQASYLRVMIRTGQLLAEIAETLGYKVVGVDLFRTRLATATREQLREEVVILEWPGTKK